MESKFKIRACIYARVSTREQAENKISIDSQIKDCKKVIIELGWELVKEPYVDEGISGHLLEERIGLQSLLADARQHIFDLVVVKDFDRFARNRASATIVREELKELFIQTYALNTPVAPKDPNTYDPTDDDLGIMVEGYSDTMSEIERNKIRRRMMMGKTAIAKAGKIPNNVPYGYKIERWIDEKGKVRRKVVTDEEQAKIVRSIFDEYIKGKGTRNIAFDLTQRGVKTPRGLLWRAQAIKYILQNQTYTGRVTWGWRHSDYGKNTLRKLRHHAGLIEKSTEHEAIVRDEIFNLAQREREIRGNSQKGRATLSRGLLTGLAKCIRCGAGVTYLTRHNKRNQKNPNWSDTTTYEYLCGGYKYSGICKRKVMSAIKLEDFVLSQIKNLINNPTARERLIFDKNIVISETLEEDYSYASKQLAELIRRRERVEIAYQNGVTNLEIYAANMQRLNEEESKYRVVADDYQYKKQRVEQRCKELEKFTNSLEDFDTLWDSATLEEKKHFLRSIIKEIRAGNGKVEIDFRF